VQKGPKYGFDALVLKVIRVGEQIKEFQVNISLFPSSLNRNTVCLKKMLFLKFLTIMEGISAGTGIVRRKIRSRNWNWNRVKMARFRNTGNR
jgi:hypothetical protein